MKRTSQMRLSLILSLILCCLWGIPAHAVEGGKAGPVTLETDNPYLVAELEILHEDDQSVEGIVTIRDIRLRYDNIFSFTYSMSIGSAKVTVNSSFTAYAHVTGNCKLEAQVYKGSSKWAYWSATGLGGASLLRSKDLDTATHNYYTAFTATAGSEVVTVLSPTKVGTK